MRLLRAASAVALVLGVASQAHAVTISDVKAPLNAKPGEEVTITWATQGPQPVVHTNVHWGLAVGNHATTTTPMSSLWAGARSWSTKLKMPAQNATLRFVIHAQDASGHVYSPEVKINVSTATPVPTPTPTPTPTPAPAGNFSSAVARLYVDADRDGRITPADDANRDQWSTARGAVFAFNNDDDDGDLKLDGSDTTLNGTDDARTMARVVVGQLTTPAATAKLSFAPANAPVRVFKKVGGTYQQLLGPGSSSANLSPSELAAAPIELLVEGSGPRSLNWDGRIALTLDVGSSRDTVALRSAPLILVDNTRPAERVFAMKIDSGQGANGPFWSSLSSGLLTQGVPLYEVKAAKYGYDRWVQDGMQLGYQGYVGPSGYAWIDDYNQLERGRGLGPLVPNELLKKNQGMTYGGKGQDESMNYGGNLEVLPPHAVNGKDYPFGRIYVGGGTSSITGQSLNRHMNKEERDLLNAQVQGPIVEISSEWLAVGHVDEFSSVIPNKSGTGRAWRIAWASPSLARAALKDLKNRGLGSLKVFEGRQSETTVNSILGNTTLMRYNELIQARLDSNKQKLMSECGLAAGDFVEVPVLFEDGNYGGVDQFAAMNPGVANLVPVNDTLYVPDPEGPRDAGVDVWRKQVLDAVAPLGLKVVFVNVFESYHELLGEAHCGSNVRYRPYDAPWWTK